MMWKHGMDNVPCRSSRICVCVCVCVIVTVMFLLPLQLVAISACQGVCVCTSDIISCPQRNLSSPPVLLPHRAVLLDLSFNRIVRLRSDWTTIRLSHLRTLLLSHNGLHFLSPEVFLQVRRLRHLDLSSNTLTHLNEFLFELLPYLEVLMLYDNWIEQIDWMAFSGLFSLQKLYLSQNRVSRFPLELLNNRNHLNKLRLLDISSNQIRSLPLTELQALPTWLKDSIYFHGNPLDCSCDLYSVLIGWQQRELHSVSEFSESHVCVTPGSPVRVAKASILQLHLQMNCSTVKVQDQVAFLNQILILECDSRFNGVKSWTLPSSTNHSSVQSLAEGRLQVGPLRLEDSGEYWCLVEGEGVNETLVVTVKVQNSTQGLGESLNTAYTTLLCCILTIILVLFYLYLTPCPCCHDNHKDSIPSSSLSEVHPLSQQGVPHGTLSEPNVQSGGITSEEKEQDERQRQKQEGKNRWSYISSDTPILV